jgi:endoglucanase
MTLLTTQRLSPNNQRRFRLWLLRGITLIIVTVGVFATALHFITPAHAANKTETNSRALGTGTQFFVPKPDSGATQQIANLLSQKQVNDASLITQMLLTPQAVWFTSGSPADVQKAVKKTVDLASFERSVPVLVAYDIPGRDCAQYSAGGAATGDDYKAWIDGFVAGLGHNKVVVLIEPDGLANLPTDCSQPDTYNRVNLINYAAHAMLKDPNASVYLDAGNSAWHSTGDMATRLVQAGLQDVQGFFLNVSNYNLNSHEVKYGTWISECVAFANNAADGGWRLGHYDWCASQYFSGATGCTVATNPNDFSTWGCTDLWYTQNLGTAVSSVHFVVDTSRNGQGSWTPPADHPAGDPQNWCNPPDRGLGSRPTANTGQPLVDAYLWVKIPGESDGQCYRWTSGPLDPVRNMADPAAGQWFPVMALELVHNANPPLKH